MVIQYTFSSLGAHMDKKVILNKFIDELNRELNTIAEAAFEAKEAATNPESKAENKYDTRGLEASYLAGAQAKRAKELRQFINQLSRLQLRSYNKLEPIESMAFVEIESEDAEKKYIFIVPKEGGMKIDIEGAAVLMISPESPLGQGLWHKKEGDVFSIKLKGQEKEFEVIQVQ